ncbi:MAG: YbaK/EbsC family protein [Actinobacteria bacterium]|nr:YbaK/EbsC family protein [Actinomycetota bacterium]
MNNEHVGHATDATEVSEHPSVARVTSALLSYGHALNIRWLADSARTAAQAAQALGIDVGQIASSLVFTHTRGTRRGDDAPPSDAEGGHITSPVLVITSGRHRVDTDALAVALGISSLGRADADFVRTWSGFAIGGVAPVGWQSMSPSTHDLARLTVVVDEALAHYPEVWAAAGHPHTVFPTTHDELLRMTGGRSLKVGE